MQLRVRILVALALAVASVPITACGPGKNDKSASGNVASPSSPPNMMPGASYAPTNPVTPSTAAIDTTKAALKHHSKLKGALVGAAAGRMPGAAAGAIQHQRNKHHK